MIAIVPIRDAETGVEILARPARTEVHPLEVIVVHPLAANRLEQCHGERRRKRLTDHSTMTNVDSESCIFLLVIYSA